jgi:hypothetical protein
MVWLSDLLKRMAKGWILLLFFVSFMLTTSLVFPWMSSTLQVPEEGVEKIDLQITYSPEKLYEIMEPYGEEGRKAYAISHLTSDVLFPIVYLFLFGTAISYTFQRAFPSESWVQRLNLVPFALLLVDFLENTILVILLLSFPTRMIWLARLAGWVTGFKWVLSGISVLLPFIGLLLWIVRRIRKGGDAV